MRPEPGPTFFIFTDRSGSNAAMGFFVSQTVPSGRDCSHEGVSPLFVGANHERRQSMGKFVKAERKRTKARIGLVGPAGSGKTMSVLKVARGLVGPGSPTADDLEERDPTDFQRILSQAGSLDYGTE